MFREALESNAPMAHYAQDSKAPVLRLMMHLRRQGITDSLTLSAIEKIPREQFLEPNFAPRAYEDCALPIACGQTISQPSIVALMTQALQLTGRQRVLEIGTGSGYQTAILSKAARMVYTIERHDDLYQQSGARFDIMSLRNIQRAKGDGHKGWPEAAPFERILVTAAASHAPEALLNQLSPEGGIMVIPLGGEAQIQNLTKFTRQGSQVVESILTPVRFVPLVEEE